MKELEDPKRARELAYQLTRKLDGSAAAGDVARRRRRVVNTALEWAVEIEELTANLLTKLKRKRVAARSPLTGRPYDLRHACITNWINAGVPVPEAAKRAGNSVEVMRRRYEGCIDGQEEEHNRKIERALGGEEETRSGRGVNRKPPESLSQVSRRSLANSSKQQ
ncbi:hypothetical protein [Streptomyces sp. NPDC048650]|uniref:hypothetical protein n=1 Tax=unclassified Streptomyces TaxID=2593676 RepID=UPI003713A760